MVDANLATQISHSSFFEALKRYDAIIAKLSGPETSKPGNKVSTSSGTLQTLAQLDQWRLHELPPLLQERKEKNHDAWLDKDEVVNLVQWKLYVERVFFCLDVDRHLS